MSRRLRNALVTSVMGVGSLALGNAGLLALPDPGGGGGGHGPEQVARLAVLTPAGTPPYRASNAVKAREEQQKAKLEALGLAVD